MIIVFDRRPDLEASSGDAERSTSIALVGPGAFCREPPLACYAFASSPEPTSSAALAAAIGVGYAWGGGGVGRRSANLVLRVRVWRSPHRFQLDLQQVQRPKPLGGHPQATLAQLGMRWRVASRAAREASSSAVSASPHGRFAHCLPASGAQIAPPVHESVSAWPPGFAPCAFPPPAWLSSDMALLAAVARANLRGCRPGAGGAEHEQPNMFCLGASVGCLSQLFIA